MFWLQSQVIFADKDISLVTDINFLNIYSNVKFEVQTIENKYFKIMLVIMLLLV